MKVRILGCGASGGVPLITGEWGRCNPDNPKNSRSRASVLVQAAGKNILIDTSPDVRRQLLDAKIDRIDAVLYTHAHADHIGGIDDLRQIYVKHKQRIPAYADSVTMQHLMSSFGYTLETLDPLYPSFLEPRLIHSDDLDLGDGIRVQPYRQVHGNIGSLGFRIGDFAYSTDLSDLPDESYATLEGLKIWVVDCLRDDPHISHIHVQKTMELIDRVKPELAVLTHMTQHLDYDDIKSRCPEGVIPAYDGMELTL